MVEHEVLLYRLDLYSLSVYIPQDLGRLTEGRHDSF